MMNAHNHIGCIPAAIMAAMVTMLLLQSAAALDASAQTGSCSICDCRVNSMDTIGTLIESKIEARLSILFPDEQCALGTDNCDENADCINTETSFTCQCRDGFEGNGVTCTDVDECETGVADCVSGATCVNTVGSFTCTCPPGRSDTSGREGEGCFAISSVPACGAGDWFTVISLDLRDPQQNCPDGWIEQLTPVRTCVSPSNGCVVGFLETIGRPFTRVAGRAIGYQVRTPEAFAPELFTQVGINSFYVEGLSVTYSLPTSSRNHIWSFAASLSESTAEDARLTCPCLAGAVSSPSFVQNNYFCESGNPGTRSSATQFFSADPLWDGEDCEGDCCSGDFMTVPWFCTAMDEVESGADIEVRHCKTLGDADENIAIELLEIYIQ